MISFIYAPAPPHGLPPPLCPSPTGYFGGLDGVDHYHGMEAGALMNSRPRNDFAELRPLSDSYFTGLAMHGFDRIGYQQAMRRARPIIAQWSEWEQQTRNPAWR